MFTRSMFGTANIAEQGALLNEVSRLVDAGTLKTTLAEVFGTISAESLRRAHADRKRACEGQDRTRGLAASSES